ncbi:proto-oncogene Mas-like [Rhinatrema bivittatum]|uniref:proto-oncogene Mas-like n=1 Tax=Rhinatrema bivittatum TaxID=194408 RepID=UPI00112E9DCA|nr:proto-oncogene Mas-like [Rhinatrema bivittatum]
MTEPILSLNTTDVELSNDTQWNNSTNKFSTNELIVVYFSLVITLLGLVGNGIVFWFLMFRIQKTSFTVYILNLAFADLLLLFSAMTIFLYIFFRQSIGQMQKEIFNTGICITLAYYAGLFLLTAISVERCLSLTYPFWYRCQRPRHQSAIVSASLWVVSVLLTYMDYFGCNDEAFTKREWKCTAMTISTASLSLLIFSPAMVLSSLILFIKVWTKTWRQHSSKLYLVIVVTVSIFILFTIPPRILALLDYFKIVPMQFFTLYSWSLFCSVVNSAANPFVYFFVGRIGKQGVMGSIQGALQKVFKEDSEISQESAPTTEASEIKM